MVSFLSVNTSDMLGLIIQYKEYRSWKDVYLHLLSSLFEQGQCANWYEIGEA